MKIELTMQIDERSEKIYWIGTVFEGWGADKKVILQVTGIPFKLTDDTMFLNTYENVTVTLYKELTKMRGTRDLKLLLLNNETKY